jgi:hypothetical protein
MLLDLVDIGFVRVVWVFCVTGFFSKTHGPNETPDTSHAYFRTTVVSVFVKYGEATLHRTKRCGGTSKIRSRSLTYQEESQVFSTSIVGGSWV